MNQKPRIQWIILFILHFYFEPFFHFPPHFSSVTVILNKCLVKKGIILRSLLNAFTKRCNRNNEVFIFHYFRQSFFFCHSSTCHTFCIPFLCGKNILISGCIWNNHCTLHTTSLHIAQCIVQNIMIFDVENINRIEKLPAKRTKRNNK